MTSRATRFSGKPHTHEGPSHVETWANRDEGIYSFITCRATAEERQTQRGNAELLKMKCLGVGTLRNANARLDSAYGWREVVLPKQVASLFTKHWIKDKDFPYPNPEAEIDALWTRICALLEASGKVGVTDAIGLLNESIPLSGVSFEL